MTCLCYRQPKSQVGRSQLVMFFLGPCIIGMAALEMMQTFFKYLSINTLEDLVPSHLSVPKKNTRLLSTNKKPLEFTWMSTNQTRHPHAEVQTPSTSAPDLFDGAARLTLEVQRITKMMCLIVSEMQKTSNLALIVGTPKGRLRSRFCIGSFGREMK